MNDASPLPDPAGPSPELIEAAAAAWLSIRDRGMNAAETAEFVHWLQQDPQHAAVFADLNQLWKSCDRLGAVPSDLQPTAAPDADLLAPRLRPLHMRTFLGPALGAAAAIVIVWLALAAFRSPHHSAETAIGAFQKLDLPDGSVALLNTDSAIDVAFTASERRVRIVRGEVFFNVAHGPSRPFVVTSGPVAVRAIGTAFNVRQHEAAIEVLVTEGYVRVDDARHGRSLLRTLATKTDPPLLAAGERAVVTLPRNASGQAIALATVEKIDAPIAQRTLAWQERRLEFDAVPLAEVVREFNRYNRTQLSIPDATLAAKRFSGTFRADGFDSLVRLLEADFGVTARRIDQAIVLSAGP